MNKSLIAFAAALCLSATTFAASHAGAPMKPASGAAATTAPAATTMPSTDTKAAAKADIKAMKKQADGDYKAAKAKCKPLKGDEEKACKKDAKAAHEKAEADIKRAQADMKAAAKKS